MSSNRKYFLDYPHTSSAISLTSLSLSHCCSSVNLLPISHEEQQWDKLKLVKEIAEEVWG